MHQQGRQNQPAHGDNGEHQGAVGKVHRAQFVPGIKGQRPTDGAKHCGQCGSALQPGQGIVEGGAEIQPQGGNPHRRHQLIASGGGVVDQSCGQHQGLPQPAQQSHQQEKQPFSQRVFRQCQMDDAEQRHHCHSQKRLLCLRRQDNGEPGHLELDKIPQINHDLHPVAALAAFQLVAFQTSSGPQTTRCHRSS